MPIQPRRNQYLGVNAHLHSYYQANDGWTGFHNSHITQLGRAIDGILPSGYVVDTEQSLQIREFHPDTGERLLAPKPDVEIYQQRASTTQTSFVSPEAVATLTQPIVKTMDLDEDLFLTALVIYKADGHPGLGVPITLIEVLSPTNKVGGDGYLQYHEKRFATLKSGMKLVEIDYLHESRSAIKGIPRYPRAPNSHPYHVTVSDPTPSFDEGVSKTYLFDVDQPIPSIMIPLAGEEAFVLDLDKVYQDTFSGMRAYSHRVDYEKLPENFKKYSATDQERIRRRMEFVRQTAMQGIDLETGPFPIPEQP